MARTDRARGRVPPPSLTTDHFRMQIRRRRTTRDVFIPLEPQAGGGAMPPGSVLRPLARWVKARRGRVEIGTFGPETLAPPPATMRRRRLNWFPGLARRKQEPV